MLADSLPEPDFRAIFDATPGPYLILSPDFVIVAMNEARLVATMSKREDMVGRPLFEMFPDNPDDPAADGVANLRASLERVIALKRPDVMAIQKYDIQRPEEEGGGFEVRYWRPVNLPVLGTDGELAYIIHYVEDATSLTQLTEADERSRELARHQDSTIAQLRLANQELARQIAARERLARERDATAAALEAEESRFQAIADKLPGIVYRGVTAPDESYRETYVSGGLFQALGVTAEHVMSGAARLFDYMHPDERAEKLVAFTVAGQKRQTVVTEIKMLRPDGGIRWWWLHTTPTLLKDGSLQWDGMALDITERRKTEQQLHHAVKMEAIGQLTGGLAHDFNNLLTVILGNAEILAEQLSDNPQLRGLAEITQTAAERGAELTSQLLAFSRRQALEPKAIDVNKLISGMDKMMRRMIGAHIEIELIRGAGLWSATADPAQLESALLNLAINARDAMGAGGKLTIETCNSHIDETYAAAHDEVTPGRYVLISVTDTGTGMTAETMAKAFDPFFSTKEVGKGTGLGLSMVFGFVKQSGGHIKIYSEIGYGTTFKMYLPRAYGPADSTDEGISASSFEPQGNETILVVEDTDILREHVLGLLRALDYRAIETSSGKEALEVLRSSARIDLLFTDIVMAGGMNGRELAEQAQVLRPGLKVLYTSGYTENAIVHQGRLDPGIHLLRKPYARRDLAAKLRLVLDGQG
ncbi:Sensor histidine kinase RcsC [Alphaproteobacteria bacterium SO-S41]|nr:Sensor histidine kinase RcsC [Alphaproteobacteria bacterium SO-S41]